MSLYPAKSKRQAFSPSCPSGGDWYACDSGTYFVGCCTQDPCNTICAQGDLYPASFDPAYHGKFPDASCGIGVDFWTCVYPGEGDTPNSFLGCCKTNPCAQGSCPKSDLQPAFLGREDLRNAYITTRTSTTQTSTLSTATSSTTTSSASTSSTDQASPSVTTESGKKVPIAAIAGGAAGGAVLLAVIAGVIIYFFYHTKRSRDDHRDSVVRRLSDITAMVTEEPKHGRPAGSSHPSVPPMYTSPHPNAYPTFYGPYGNMQQQQHPNMVQTVPELPCGAISPRTSVGRKPLHVRGASELSGETARRSELESPIPPSSSQIPYSPHSPHSPQSPGGSAYNGYAGTTAHNSWQPRQPSQDSHAQGLGMWSEGQEVGRQQEIRGYPGI